MTALLAICLLRVDWGTPRILPLKKQFFAMDGAAQLTLELLSGLSAGSDKHHHIFKVFLTISGVRDNVSFLNGSWNLIVTSQNQEWKARDVQPLF